MLQGFGVEINQLRQSSPTSQLLPNGGALGGLPQPGVEGILVTRIRFDQQRAEFQRNVNIMLANVEFAYWNLYNAYWNLYVQEAALRQAYEAWKIAEVKLQAGKIAVADVAQAPRPVRIVPQQPTGRPWPARAADRQPTPSPVRRDRGRNASYAACSACTSRTAAGWCPAIADPRRPIHPDWCTAWQEAMQNAPSLILAREQLKADQLNVRLAENALLPDLRFAATYDVNSIGGRLDGPDTGRPTTPSATWPPITSTIGRWPCA